MNERIKELSLQASKEAFPIGSMAWMEKFAELIILECANITLDYKNHDHYMGWVDHGEEIARHFGVER